MTDAVFLPGTELEVYEKYPLSRRLDHPHFSDVSKTTFAKGVITEFDRISDDPIKVKPMVKVSGEFGETENFIPIFYNPRPQYWDDDLEGVSATDYDEEHGYFEQAWQSFRCGDEVVVVLKDGVPVAVLGFPDGVPRIGEAILQMEYETARGASQVYQWQPSLPGPGSEGPGCPYGTFNVENYGPDGYSLGLKTAALKVCDSGLKEATQTGITSTPYELWPITEPPTWEYNISTLTLTVKRQYLEYFFTIGPIAYIVQVLHEIIESTLTYSLEGHEVVDATPPDYHHTLTGGFPLTRTFKSEFSVFSKIYTDQVKEDSISLGKTHEGVDLTTSFVVRPPWCIRYDASDYIEPVNPSFRGNEENYGYRGPDWSGWLFHPDFSVRLNTSFLNQDTNTSLNQIALGTLDIFTRPHTKSELQAANMWPGT